MRTLGVAILARITPARALGCFAALCMASAMGGAAIGAAMEPDALREIADVRETLPAARAATATGSLAAQIEGLPDHYAMETPAGRVEVEELAMYGRDHRRWQAHQRYRAHREANPDVEFTAISAEDELQAADIPAGPDQEDTRYAVLDIADQPSSGPAAETLRQDNVEQDQTEPSIRNHAVQQSVDGAKKVSK
ncbi:hypothetical protein [Aurantiacibacter gangjinensis]|nr:hypothetical protein [Aurantiacibacter gangjinensis]